MMFERIGLILLVVLCFGLLGASGGVCFTDAELKQIEALKRKAATRAKIIAALRKQIAEMKTAALQGRIERQALLLKAKPCRACACALPWIVTGVVGGACGAGLITLGVLR